MLIPKPKPVATSRDSYRGFLGIAATINTCAALGMATVSNQGPATTGFVATRGGAGQLVADSRKGSLFSRNSCRSASVKFVIFPAMLESACMRSKTLPQDSCLLVTVGSSQLGAEATGAVEIRA